MENRWKLILGTNKDDKEQNLSTDELEINQLLDSAYGDGKGNTGGFGRSVPKVRKWLEGIRRHFSPEIVSLLQRDALERQNAKEMLLEPELLEQMEPNIQLVANILELQDLLPEASKKVSRKLVERLVRTIEERLKVKLLNAVRKGLASYSERINPRNAIIDWKKTIARNIKNYQSNLQVVVPNNWYGFRKGSQLKEIILLVDKSESMIESAINASILGSILSSLKTIRTQLVFFDTEITDVTEKYQDPIDILFSIPMGGGTDIGNALNYIHYKISRPMDSILFLISDLDDGGSLERLLAELDRLISRKTRIQCIPALNDEGKPVYNKKIADLFETFGIPVYSSKPDDFPEILCKQLEKLS